MIRYSLGGSVVIGIEVTAVLHSEGQSTSSLHVYQKDTIADFRAEKKQHDGLRNLASHITTWRELQKPYA